MIRVPDKSKFPGTCANGNGIPVAFKSQDQWLNMGKTKGCRHCNPMRNCAPRPIPEALGHFDSSLAAWARRIQSGPAGSVMVAFMAPMLTPDGGHPAAPAGWNELLK